MEVGKNVKAEILAENGRLYWKQGNVPIGCTAEPIEIAYGTLYLASDESPYCCETCLLIDGGLF